jgi:predicted DNA-binding transcriptional regulator AlpA
MPTKTTLTQPRVAFFTPEKVRALLEVIANGSGDELLTLHELKVTGCHPFSNSTRIRKIHNKEYPKPIKISQQMCLFKAGDIRRWRKDPNGFKNKGAKND